ncbi:MAG: SDR family oxidoreductase [Proteobacteria bacterium]|nr:SDR family oxidoreductase [Pseudomonadota bacterium]
MGKLEGKVAVITGGASGIGKASVELFVKEGARVVFGDVMDDRGMALADELGGDVLFQHTDVAQEEQLQSLIALAAEKFGRLDCMFNNAGIGGASGPIDETPTLGFDVTVAVDFRSVFLGMKLAAPIMKQQGSGRIISTASIAGHRTGFGGHIYSACKAAIIQMTRTVANELGPFGINVNCICPGGVVTSIFGRTFGQEQDATEASYDGLAKVFNGLQSIPRACMPEDIAKAAIFLAGEDSGYINGAAINVDGGVPDGMSAKEGMAEELGGVLGIEIPTSEPPPAQ